MIKLNNSVIKNAVVYLGGGSLVGLISYILMPVLSRYLSPADYGLVYMFGVLNMFFVSSIGLQSDTYFTKHYFEYEKPVLAEHVGAILKVIVFSMLFVLSAVLIFNKQLAAALSISGNLITLAVIIGTLTFIGVFILRYYQLEGKALKYVYISLAVAVINITVSLFLVVYLRLGWKGRIIGISIPILIQALISIIVLNKNGLIKFGFDLKHVKSVVFFGLPLVLGSLGGWVVNLADKVFITKMVSISATGIYGIGSSMGMIMGIIVDSCARAWVPYFFKNIRDNSPETNIKIVKITYLYSVVVIAMSFAVTFLSYIFIRYFLAVEYRTSFDYVIWISLGQGIAGIRSIFIYYLIYKNKNYVLSAIIISTSILNIALNYFLIRSFGTMGAAYTVFLTSLAATVLTIGFGAKYHKMPWLFFLQPKTP